MAVVIEIDKYKDLPKFLKQAIDSEIKKATEIELEEAKKRIDKRKDEIIAGVVLYVHKMIQMENIHDRIMKARSGEIIECTREEQLILAGKLELVLRGNPIYRFKNYTNRKFGWFPKWAKSVDNYYKEKYPLIYSTPIKSSNEK